MDAWAVKYQLLNSSADYVFEWLKSNAIQVQECCFLNEDRESLENALLARNENLINLGLALFCRAPSVGFKLYESGDHTIKRAALSGLSVKPVVGGEITWILHESVLPRIIYRLEKECASEDFELIKVILSNNSIPDDILLSLYKKDCLFSSISDNLWIKLLWESVNNKRISTPYKETSAGIFDGFDEYRYNSLFHAAWALFEHLPATHINARFLSLLSERIVPEVGSLNFEELVVKWNGDDYFFDVRKNLVKTLGCYNDKFKTLGDRDDLALRLGFYENIKYLSLSDFQSYLDKDGENFLREAVYNDSFYYKKELRNALSDACNNVSDADSVFSLSEKYYAKLEEIKALMPEVFFDCEFEEDLPFNSIENHNDSVEVKVRFLMYKLSKLELKIDEILERDVRNSNTEINIGNSKQPRAYSILWFLVFILFLVSMFRYL